MINHIKAEEKNVILNVYFKERILYKKKIRWKNSQENVKVEIKKEA